MEKKTISHVIGLSIVVVLAISVFIYVRNELNQGSIPSSSVRNEHQAPATLEYKLAVINFRRTLPADHYSIRYFKQLLLSIATKCKNNQQEISDISVTCYQELKKTEATTLLQVMKDLNDSIPLEAKSLQVDLSDIAVLYLALKASKN